MTAKTLIKTNRWILIDTGERYELITGSYESLRLIYAWEKHEKKPKFADCVEKIEGFLKGHRYV